MEKRIILAFALSFLIVALYLRVRAPQPPFEPPEPPPQQEIPAQPQLEEPPSATSETVPERREAAEAPEEPAGEGAPEGDFPIRRAATERSVEVETPLYRAVLSNRGARLASFVLKNYRDNQGKPYEMVPLEASERLGIHPLDVVVEDTGRTRKIQSGLYEISRSGLELGSGETGEVELAWSDGNGLEVVKTLGFSGSSYQVETEVSVRYRGEELPKQVLYGPGLGEELLEGTYIYPEKGLIKAGGEVALFDASDIRDGAGAAVAVQGVGISAHYFIAVMMPRETGYGAELSVERFEVEGANPRDLTIAGLAAPAMPVRMAVFVGPKDQELLSQIGMDAAIEYGAWMRYLAVPLRSALLWINDFVGNYGWSIVLLTVLINVALIPLKHHSYVSMRKMQKLGPQIKRIQERYKKLKPTDPRRQEMNQEIYALYKEHNVSPVSGCLPMLLMIPFFFAFYRLLTVSIELRHAPFVFWIQDLSTYDPYFVLPILMGVSQIAMQQMTPQTTADPMQAKVMKLLPVFFVFILAWAPAGLVLYWFVNNLVSVGQQSVTNRLQGNGEATPAAPSAREKEKARKVRG